MFPKALQKFGEVPEKNNVNFCVFLVDQKLRKYRKEKQEGFAPSPGPLFCLNFFIRFDNINQGVLFVSH